MLLTITAPIRLASKTTAEIEEEIRTLLRRGSARRDVRQTIHWNRVVIRILKGGPQRAPKLIGFVHNPETDAVLLLNMTSEMLDVVRDVARRRKGGWLVVMTGRGVLWLEAYRYIYSEVRMANDFQKVVMAFGDERVEVLAGK